MCNEPGRAGEVVQKLGEPDAFMRNYLRKKPMTIAGTDYQTAEVLQILTGADAEPRDGIGAWWGPFAALKAHTCEHCQFLAVAAPALEWDPKLASCARWRGEEAATCQNWLGAEDPAWLFLYWRFKAVVEKSELQIELHEKQGWHYIADVEEFALALEYGDKAVCAERAEQERFLREGWLDEMRAYWQAQPVGLGPGFDLVNVQSHTCRLCANYRPDSLEDLAMPCRFALDPLTERWRATPRAPRYAVMVRADGVTVPRCERFRAAEVPTLDPVRGVRFPEDPDGRADVLEWLGRILASDGCNPHHGALVGPLAWLPYDRAADAACDPELALAWILENWRECGGDRGVARLLSIAVVEVEARESWAPFDLVDPTTGDLNAWVSVPWDVWAAGERIKPGQYGLSKEWPQPWAKDGAADGQAGSG